MDRGRFERVAIVGSSSAGKTTLARALSRAMDAPHVELDALYWGPDWTPRPREVFRAAVQAAVGAPRWVVDGNYSVARDLVWGRATAVVWLDYSFFLIYPRALSRTFRRIVSQEPLWADNRESLRNALDPDWIPWWILRTFRRRRREYPALFRRAEFAHLDVHRLAHPR